MIVIPMTVNHVLSFHMNQVNPRTRFRIRDVLGAFSDRQLAVCHVRSPAFGGVGLVGRRG